MDSREIEYLIIKYQVNIGKYRDTNRESYKHRFLVLEEIICELMESKELTDWGYRLNDNGKLIEC